MTGFSFSFSTDDTDDTDDCSINVGPLNLYVSESDNKRRQTSSGLGDSSEKNLDAKVHILESMLETLPSRLAYSTLKIPLDNGLHALIPRRELWDVRLQLMAAQDDENLANLDEVDLKTGVYEGGFKSWESSSDLVKVLQGRIKPVIENKSMFLELGCGTALPSLYVFQELLRSVSNVGQAVSMGLADYNPAVLHLVTLPNLILSWAIVRRSSWDNEGELEIDKELIQEFLSSLNSFNITLSFFSGGWSSKFAHLVLENMNLDVTNSTLVGAETIYSQFALNSFAEMIISLLQSISCTQKSALVAAKKFYFGVGGSMDEFCNKIRLNGGLIDQILEIPDGVRRVVTEVQIPNSSQSRLASQAKSQYAGKIQIQMTSIRLPDQFNMDQFNEEKRQKTVIVGGGPVGSLAALYAAQRGHEVEIYELRSDLRDSSTTPLNFTRSINLALSKRGITALWHSERKALTEKILEQTIPMTGRMIHYRDKSGSLYEESQAYDVNGKAIYAIDRSDLNNRLLNELDSLPNVKLFFNHKLISVDFKSQKAWMRSNSAPNVDPSSSKENEIEVGFDLLIGADGAHSATRQHLMKHVLMNYKQFYIDTLWCEFTIKANDFPNDLSPNSKFKISPDHLHIWPGKEYMFIAIPSLNGEFTCTLFMPASLYEKVSDSPDALVEFFHEKFPGVTPELISPQDLVESFNKNPHLPLISITCSPHHYSHCAVLLGDATHAMVPFYGQGMNAGFEDVRVLFQTLDKYLIPDSSAERRALALQEYSALRTVDSQAISQLALENYEEMRSSVSSVLYKSRKWLEERLSLWFPYLGWATKYSRVSFGNERYSEVIRRSEWQGIVLGRALGGIGIGTLSVICWGIYSMKSATARFPSR